MCGIIPLSAATRKTVNSKTRIHPETRITHHTRSLPGLVKLNNTPSHRTAITSRMTESALPQNISYNLSYELIFTW